MKDREILKKAIEKCGWKFPEIKNVNEEIQEPVIIWKGIDKFIVEWLFDESYYQIIFSHDFAKEFWGEEEVYEYIEDTGEVFCKEAWKFHLQQMILEKEPLKYLEKFL